MGGNPILNEFAAIIRSGFLAPLMVVMLLGMLLLPLPPLALDVLFTFNISLALVVLFVSIYTLRPLNFAAFPTVILIATMLRLALNVASTRVMLVNGHEGTDAAGQVIEAFGAFVVQGNYAVGLVVFAILVIINFVVVTKGAGRVSEVSARFTLDSMPGKQMAIDADLNAGAITQEEAKNRREEVTREADFYGSMDGASKFVRGDAIAGVLILFINIIGGLSIGMAQHGMAFSDAVQNYTLLTIGDGLVAQVPALVLSIATAIIVTRVSAAEGMSDQLMRQMFDDPRTLVVTSGIVGILGLVPGMPNFAFLLVSALCGTLAYWLAHKRRTTAVEVVDDAPPEAAVSGDGELSWDDVKPVDAVGLEIGYRLIQLVDNSNDAALMGRIKGVRRKLSQELGFLVPPVHIRDNLDLPQNAYRITIRGITEAEAEVMPDNELAINPGAAQGEIQGTATRDPAFGMAATWITRGQRDHALALGYTVVDAGTVIATHLNKVLQEHAHELLGYEEVQKLLEALSRHAPKLVEDLVPKTLPLGLVVKVLQNLLLEGVPIRDMRTIAEALAENATSSQDADTLTAAVRIALRRTIVQKINGIRRDLAVITLDPRLEQLLQQSLQGDGASGPSIEPNLAERLQQSLSDCVQRQDTIGEPSVLVVAPGIRHWISRLFMHVIPGLNVLAYTEIPENKQVRIVQTIGQDASAQVA